MVVLGTALVVLITLALAACRPAVRPDPQAGQAPHPGDAWFAFRAQSLGISVEEARARDAALSEAVPPVSARDAQARAEAALLWSSICASCHGMEGRLEGVAVTDPPPRKFGGFGMWMGFTMGGDEMRAGLYRKIRDGGTPIKDQPPRMPPFRDALSREQIWALVGHIEGL
jgi:mono/diheme cytochrome c family protein